MGSSWCGSRGGPSEASRARSDYRMGSVRAQVVTPDWPALRALDSNGPVRGRRVPPTRRWRPLSPRSARGRDRRTHERSSPCLAVDLVAFTAVADIRDESAIRGSPSEVAPSWLMFATTQSARTPTAYHPERCSASDSALFGTTDRPRRYPGEDRPYGDTHDRPERYPAARRLAPAWRPPPLSVAERESRHVVGERRPGERLRRVQLPEPALRPVVGRRLVPGPVLGVPGEDPVR